MRGGSGWIVHTVRIEAGACGGHGNEALCVFRQDVTGWRHTVTLAERANPRCCMIRSFYVTVVGLGGISQFRTFRAVWLMPTRIPNRKDTLI